uniref:Uncharacterized protein n=1 Tax=Thermosporothrix sp. COM3 TaxID=2490863 RepID=A0A455SBA9_9CHLR|nr:hypothetical protein KTC_04980 [Thermosporothrix sp. COM3]
MTQLTNASEVVEEMPVAGAPVVRVQQPEHSTPSVKTPLTAFIGLESSDNGVTLVELVGDSVLTETRQLSGNVGEELSAWLSELVAQRHQQIIAAAIRKDDTLAHLFSRLWLKEDIVPFIIAAPREEPLEKLVREVAANFDAQNVVQIPLSLSQEVGVADLVTLDDYRAVTVLQDFALLSRLVQAFQGKRLVFVNATPRGGGVALMRHALIRLLRLMNVDAHWYVLVPNAEVFDITKRKFHNVLQAVAAPDVVLTDEDKAVFNAWSAENAHLLHDVFKQADVLVIDDPQPAGLIPYIKQANPHAHIIYRSHIQIVSSLASQPGTPQNITWEFLWQTIKDADYFVSHPMSMFVPKNVPDDKVLYMPATTDPLDGLNKELSEEQMEHYLHFFNEILEREGQTPLDLTRPYIVQIARFDPSKGIPDVLEAYRRLCIMLQERQQPVPQLVIAGNGSVDDPDGVPIFNHVQELLRSDLYAALASDVKVARLPHRDQLLNTLLRKSSVVLQLSTKEGFEVKVTEALMKGKPVVAYHVGGIPLQIVNGVNGHLVEVGNTVQVAQHIYDLLTDTSLYERMSMAAVELAGKDYLTVPNAICWLYLALTLLKNERLEGRFRWVAELARKEWSGVADEEEGEDQMQCA